MTAYGIPLSECRGQGYDNGSNMRGEYSGAQNYIEEDLHCLLAIYCPCACQTLNLVGIDFVKCCLQAITFFGVAQECYTIFSSSPQRWKILKKQIKSSLHCLSDTRWSAHVDAVKPFAALIPELRATLDDLGVLNLTVEIRSDMEGLKKYNMSTFECVLVSFIWLTVLTAINEVNVVLKTREATTDIQVSNLANLTERMQFLRGGFQNIWMNAKL